MKLRRIKVKNFRKLTDISVELNGGLSVIVGPNAIGKSTIFEAVRLAKAILFPRMQDELRLVLISLGATSAHFANSQLNYDISALAGDVERPVVIALLIDFSTEEVEVIRDSIPRISRNLVAAQLGRSFEDPTFDLRAYFATPIGQESERQARVAVEEAFKQISSERPIEVRVEISALQIMTSPSIMNLFVGALEQRLTPDKALFSYFPADRALPVGEVALQIGPQDFKAQIDSHFSQASAKYGRLKQTVVNQTVLANINQQDLKPEFDSIFEVFLPGKEFVGLQQKVTGLIAVLVKDRDSGKIFDMDSLSSGEKGLVLSFLLFKTTVSRGSVILVDELELHLNPAVCRKILGYLADTVIKNLDCQFIISTHSAEIMRDAFDREDAQLFHLRSDVDISPVLPQDKLEVLEIIRRLGVSTEQALTAKALLFVEGDTDAQVLEAAFPSVLAGVQIRSLHGRAEVEKSIKDLQNLEKAGYLREAQGFLFDFDRKPTSLKGSSLVRVEQLNKYCIENYLLDETALYDLLGKHSVHPPTSRGEFSRELKELALEQLHGVVLELVLNRYRVRAGLTNSEVKSKTLGEVAAAQFAQLKSARTSIDELLSDDEWLGSFEAEYNRHKRRLEPEWDNNWKVLASGKRLFEGMQRKYQINVDLTRFKVLLSEVLGRSGKDDITALRAIIDRLVAS